MMRNEITEAYKMPDGSHATIRAYISPKGVYGARLEFANGKTLPMSIVDAHHVRSLKEAMRGAKLFLRGVYGK